MSTRFLRLPSSLVPLAGLALMASMPALAVAVGPERAGELVRLVRQDCGSCHGMTLKGGLGKGLMPEDVAALETESLAAIILDGVPGTPMPPWRGLLSPSEAEWIAARLKEGFPQ